MCGVRESLDGFVVQQNEVAAHAVRKARASAQSRTSSGSASGCRAEISAAARRKVSMRHCVIGVRIAEENSVSIPLVPRSFGRLARNLPLDSRYANVAASVRQAARISVADAHIGAVVQSASADRISVITSDPADMRRIAWDRNVIVVTI